MSAVKLPAEYFGFFAEPIGFFISSEAHARQGDVQGNAVYAYIRFKIGPRNGSNQIIHDGDKSCIEIPLIGADFTAFLSTLPANGAETWAAHTQRICLAAMVAKIPGSSIVA